MWLIDVDALFDSYYANWEYHCVTLGQDDRDWLKQCIDQAPTIDAVPVVHGRWETRKVIDGFPPQYHHFHNDLNCKYGYGDYNCVGHPYCPNCGAKMEQLPACGKAGS